MGPPGPAGLQGEEALPGQPTLVGWWAVTGSQLPGLALVSVPGQAVPVPIWGSGSSLMMRGLAGSGPPAPSSLHLHPKEAPGAVFSTRGGPAPLLFNSGKTNRRCEIHSLVAVTTMLLSHKAPEF